MTVQKRIPRWLAVPWWALFVLAVLEILVWYTARSFLWPRSSWDDPQLILVGWSVLQPLWLFSVSRRYKALFWFLAGLMLSGLRLFQFHLPGGYNGWLATTVSIAEPIAGLVSIFWMRHDLETYAAEEVYPGYHLSGVMTFFFSIFYFQYHLHAMAEVQRADEAPIASFTTPGPA